MTLLFRRAQSADVAGLADLAALTFPLACPPSLAREAVESFIAENLSEDSFRDYLQEPAHSVLVGVDDGGAVRAYALLVNGTTMDEDCSGLLLVRPTLGISKFYLDPDLHGAGGAARLLDAVVDFASAAEVRSLWLATNIGNARARSFYAKHGFVERGQRDFVVGGVVNRDVVLERPL